MPKTVAHTVVGGLRSELSGGRFRDGALDALAAQLATPAISQVPGEGNLGKVFRTIIAAAVGGAVSESMGGDFGAGVLLAAYTWLFNHESEKLMKPDFDSMTNQELADWILENASSLGIDVADGVTVEVIDEYRAYSMNLRAMVICETSVCEGIDEDAIYGNYDPNKEIVYMYKPAFEAGNKSLWLPGNKLVNSKSLTRQEVAILTFGHESAHSVGIDLTRGGRNLHANAEKREYNAMKNFQKHYD